MSASAGSLPGGTHARRHRVPLLLLWAALAAPLASRAQTVEDVVARYVAARGGIEAWRSIASLAFSGSFESFSREEPFTLSWKRPGFYRFDTTMQGRPLILAVDGESPWWVHGLYGIETAARPEAPDDGLLRREAQIEPPLMDFAGKGHKVELLGRGEVDGSATIDLKLTLATGEVETWHLDAETYLEVAIDSTTYDYTQTGEPISQRTYLSDFRQVRGVRIPHQIEREYKARYTKLVVEKVEVNPDLPDERFRMPEGGS